MAGSASSERPVGADLAERVSVLLRAHAPLFPASVLCGPAGDVRRAGDLAHALGEPPVCMDLNLIVDQALNALGADLAAAGASLNAFLDPGIGAATGHPPIWTLLAAALLRYVWSASPVSPDLSLSIDLATGQAGDQVCVEVSRAGAAAPAEGALEDLLRLVADLAGARLETRFERGEAAAAVRLPARPWDLVSGQVLTLDDALAVREVICRILGRTRIQPEALATVEDLEARLTAGPAPALILVEASVWGARHGWAIEWLAMTRPDLAPRTVVMTCNASSAETGRALAALHRRWFLAKPFSAAALLALVRRRLMCLSPGG